MSSPMSPSSRNHSRESLLGGIGPPASPSRKAQSRATLSTTASTVGPWGDVPVEFCVEGGAKKTDFLGLYDTSKEADSPHLGDYEASLLTKGRQNGLATFIAPMDEGLYVVRLVRNESEELGSVAFRVVNQCR